MSGEEIFVTRKEKSITRSSVNMAKKLIIKIDIKFQRKLYLILFKNNNIWYNNDI